jgi:DNA-binding PadR family transcriptional regulator
MRRKADQLIPLEIAILETALALRKDGTEAVHGYQLAKVLQAQSKRRLLTAHGTLYRALHRLERAGLVEGFWENPRNAEEEGRPRRRMYRLTALSGNALAPARAQQRATGRLRALKEGLDTT